MHVDWQTLALQAVNFLILIWLLQRFLYKPVRAVIERRRLLAEKAFADTDRSRTELEEQKRSLENERAGVEAERRDLLRAAHEQLEQERGRIIEQAKREAETIVKSGREQLDKERARALDELKQQITETAVKAASVLLQHAAPEALNMHFLGGVERRFAELPGQEQALLRSAAAGAGVTTVTSTALDAAQQKQWRERLGELLGDDAKIEFSAAPEIIGGVELRFPHATLKYSWSAQLDQEGRLLNERDTAA
jgi:F-type H+-transporting ATPase subunit b